MTPQAFLSLATAFGLSTAAGLNAYIPLLVVALLARVSSLITLSGPYEAMSSWWVIGILAVLLFIEIVVDKIPVADTANDVIHTIIRPTAGAILFAATTDVITLHPVLAAICGVIVAGGVHVVKTGGRPVMTAMTGGVGTPVVSTLEDVVSLVTSILAVVVPILAAILLASALALFIWWYLRRQKRRQSNTRC